MCKDYHEFIETKVVALKVTQTDIEERIHCLRWKSEINDTAQGYTFIQQLPNFLDISTIVCAD